MIIKKTLSLKQMYAFTGHYLWWVGSWMSLVTSVYFFTHWKLMPIPWLPLSLIGTAVAFYVGFKNNHSYDRLWGGITVWTEIINNSRAFAVMIKNYWADEPSSEEGTALKKQIIFRQIAWCYQLRLQLLKPAKWEHLRIKIPMGIGYNNQRRHTDLQQLYSAELNELENQHYLSAMEKTSLQEYHNKAAHLLDRQAEMVQQLYVKKIINTVQQLDIQDSITRFYDKQGNAERIKQYPLPRKYASFSFVFVCIFIALLPFGIIGEFSKLGDTGIWLTIPVGTIVGWIYVVMEMVGDYSENPFEGLYNDVPMLSMCRSIEIDLLQMLGEQNIPAPITPKGHVLL